MTTKRHNISHATLAAVSAISAAAAIDSVCANILRGIENSDIPGPVALTMRNDVAEFQRLADAIRSGEKPLADFVKDFTSQTDAYVGLHSNGQFSDSDNADRADLDATLAKLFDGGPNDSDEDEDEDLRELVGADEG